TDHKVTIVPRGLAGGYAVMLPKERRYFITKPELLDRITCLLGGRASEEIIFGTGNVSTCASNDFQLATEMANKMITELGLSEIIANAQFNGGGGGGPFLGRDISEGKDYSDAIAHEIDKETQRIIDTCHQRALDILSEYEEQLKTVAGKLLEIE